MNKDIKDKYEKVRNKLNNVGCGMCLAKWTQVTIHLHLGRNHSCHHPDTHPIPIEEIKKDPSALHNTSFKKLKRKEMLDGKRPSECSFCWSVEDNSTNFSDRTYKSAEEWSLPHYDTIVESPWDKNIYPKYVEVAFANTCNLKCSYCGPSFSSSWVQEAEQFGGYPTSDNFNDIKWMKENGRMPFKNTDYNPYIEAFWKWWPDLYHNLHTFRITGGEPLLAKDTWKVLDYIIETNNPNRILDLSINSNLSVPDALIDKLIDKINRITDPVNLLGLEKSKVGKFVLFTSIDGWGKQAEYGRNGLEFTKFWDNLNKILTKCPKITISIMSTYNALSVPSYFKLIDEVHKLKVNYHNPDRSWGFALGFDATHLRNPIHQTAQIIPDEFKVQCKQQSELMDKYIEDEINTHKLDDAPAWTFTGVEVEKLRRIHDWVMSPIDDVILNRSRANFYRFFNAHDERRGTNFIETFPDYTDFFEQCRRINASGKYS